MALADQQPVTSWRGHRRRPDRLAGNEVVAGYRIQAAAGSGPLRWSPTGAPADGITSLAVVAGAIGVLAGYPLADPIVGLLITVAILAVLRSAARDIYRRMMDAVDPHLVDAAEASLRSVPGVRDVEDLRVRWIGHRFRAETDLAVDSSDLGRGAPDRPGPTPAAATCPACPTRPHVSPAAEDDLAAHEAVATACRRPARTPRRRGDGPVGVTAAVRAVTTYHANRGPMNRPCGSR
jgi:hypothetical protein